MHKHKITLNKGFDEEEYIYLEIKRGDAGGNSP
jgi:hypothetical protein